MSFINAFREAPGYFIALPLVLHFSHYPAISFLGYTLTYIAFGAIIDHIRDNG